MLRLFWHAWRKHRPEIALEFGLGQGALRHVHDLVGMGTPALYERLYPRARAPSPSPGQSDAQRPPAAALGYYRGLEIGSASCGARVSQYVESSAVGVS